MQLFQLNNESALIILQRILLQNGGKLHVKDIADGIVESGLIPPRLVLIQANHHLQTPCDTYNVFNEMYTGIKFCIFCDGVPV